MLIYCQVADEGGGTTFANADVFVQPRATDAVLFSYYDPKTGDMDTGLTEVRSFYAPSSMRLALQLELGEAQRGAVDSFPSLILPTSISSFLPPRPPPVSLPTPTALWLPCDGWNEVGHHGMDAPGRRKGQPMDFLRPDRRQALERGVRGRLCERVAAPG